MKIHRRQKIKRNPNRVHYSRDMAWSACNAANPRFTTRTIWGITCADCRTVIKAGYDHDSGFRKLLITECGTDDIAVIADAVRRGRRADASSEVSPEVTRETSRVATEPGAVATGQPAAKSLGPCGNCGHDDADHVGREKLNSRTCTHLFCPCQAFACANPFAAAVDNWVIKQSEGEWSVECRGCGFGKRGGPESAPRIQEIVTGVRPLTHGKDCPSASAKLLSREVPADELFASIVETPTDWRIVRHDEHGWLIKCNECGRAAADDSPTREQRFADAMNGLWEFVHAEGCSVKSTPTESCEKSSDREQARCFTWNIGARLPAFRLWWPT